MSTSFLFPHQFKKFGWLLLCLGITLGLFYQLISWLEIDLHQYLNEKIANIILLDFNDSVFEEGWLDELISILLIIGGLLVGFSKTKVEDEFINQLRFNSLVWSVYVSYAILFIAVIFIYDMAFFQVMTINMFTVLLFFVARFHILLRKANRL